MTSAHTEPASSVASVDHTHSLPTKRIGAGVLFFNQAGQVLLVQTAYKSGWEIPGGCVERDEAPRQAAMREIAEELGLAVAPGRILAVDWVPPHGGRTDGLMTVFDGGYCPMRTRMRSRCRPKSCWTGPGARLNRRYSA